MLNYTAFVRHMPVLPVFVACLLACPAPVLSAQNVGVTVDWSAPTGISSTDTSFGLNTQLTDPHVVGDPGNSVYKSHLGYIAPQFIRVWGGSWQDSSNPDGWLFHSGLPDESFDREKIKKTFQNFAPYGPEHVMVTIGSWPGYMADPVTGALQPAHYADFAKYSADLVRIINKENPGGRHVDLFEVLNEREGFYSNPGDGLLLGQIVAQAARAMKAVDPTIKVGGPAYSWAVQGETKNFILGAGNAIDFMSWHEYATGPDDKGNVSSTAVVWATGNQGKANSAALSINKLLVENLGHTLPLFADEYAINWMCWQPADPRCSTATEAVYDGLKVVSYLRGGAGSAKWNEADSTYGVLTGADANFSYRPAAHLFSVLNHHFIGTEETTTTTDGTKVVPFAVRPQPAHHKHRSDSISSESERKENIVGSLLLIHTVEQTADTVNLNLLNLPKSAKKIIVSTITDAGLTTSTIPVSAHLTLTLPPTSVVALTFEKENVEDSD